jgi:hypothetical protein
VVYPVFGLVFRLAATASLAKRRSRLKRKALRVDDVDPVVEPILESYRGPRTVFAPLDDKTPIKALNPSASKRFERFVRSPELSDVVHLTESPVGLTRSVLTSGAVKVSALASSLR